jgi:hypothetical protein
MVDDGEFRGDEYQWDSRWEPEEFIAGEELDETDPLIDTSNLTEGEDFVRL